MNFSHLHVHNEYSLLDGLGTADQYAERAAEIGLNAIALTNHGNVDGCIKWQAACKEHGVKSILGFEGYIVPDMSVKEKGEKRSHITLLAKNFEGWKNLLKILTYSNIQGFYYKPRVDPDLLLQYLTGDIVVLSACVATFLHQDWGVKLLEDMKDTTDVFLEVMPNDMLEQYATNELCLKLSKKYNLPIVATNDCHYIRMEDCKLQEVLLAMQSKSKMSDPNRWKFDIDTLYLMDKDEMVEAFKKQEIFSKKQVVKFLDNTGLVADLCDLYIDKVEVNLPEVEVPQYPDLSPEDQLRELAYDGLIDKSLKHKEIEDKFPEYQDRVDEELGLIIDLGFANYFLIVWELISWCKANDILTGPGRGSVGGCLAAYCLGITMVDPIKFDLVFSRFISEGRIDLPDIDMDFEDIKRDKIRKHLEDVYGEHCVTGVSTFSKMHGRGALRDVARVYDIPLVDVDKAAKSIVVRSGGDVRADFSIKDAFETFEDGKNFYKKYPKVSEVAMALEGQVKNCGKHAAAMCVSGIDLRAGENMAFALRKKELICNWDKEDNEYMGMMKLDVLGLNALTIIAETLKLIKKRKGVDIDLELIPLDDKNVLDAFTKSNNIGVFQFNSPGMKKLCRQIKTEDFEQVVALNALHRPGCLRSGMATEYKMRKQGEKEVKYIHPFIEDITKNTYGLILYQEQIMMLLYTLGGLQWKTTDMVRKVISKSQGVEQFKAFEELFVSGCKERGTLSEEDAKKVFDELKYFGSYGFNKSHSVEYSLISFWEMWLKINYPIEFLSITLSCGPDDKKSDFLAEARRMNIKILLPDINESESKSWSIVSDDKLLIPFQEIKGVGGVAAEEIVREREKNGMFDSEDDLASRVQKRKVNSRVSKLLVATMAYDSLVDKSSIGEEVLDDLSEYFSFNLSNDPGFKYRKLISKLGENIVFQHIASVDFDSSWDSPDKILQYYFGFMELLRFGYRKKLDRSLTDLESGYSGTVGSMGGVYGNFIDDTDFTMLVFDGKLYGRKKELIEHCEGKWFIANCNHPFRTAALHAHGIWFGDDLLKGEVDGLPVEFMESVVYPKAFTSDFTNELKNCDSCNLRSECKSPVLPSKGQYNIMIIGEAPGGEEDRVGEGFRGDTGKLLFGQKQMKGLKSLVEFGIDRDWCHITNVAKCYPSKTKTPKRANVKACSKFLEREIETVKPYVILAFGNTCNLFFKGEEKGIMSLNATTEWSDTYNCWICWSNHPSSVLYSSENIPLVNAALENFVEKVYQLGFGEKLK